MMAQLEGEVCVVGTPLLPKKYAERIQPVEYRKQEVQRFLHLIKPSLRVEVHTYRHVYDSHAPSCHWTVV